MKMKLTDLSAIWRMTACSIAVVENSESNGREDAGKIEEEGGRECLVQRVGATKSCDQTGWNSR